MKMSSGIFVIFENVEKDFGLFDLVPQNPVPFKLLSSPFFFLDLLR